MRNFKCIFFWTFFSCQRSSCGVSKTSIWQVWPQSTENYWTVTELILYWLNMYYSVRVKFYLKFYLFIIYVSQTPPLLPNSDWEAVDLLTSLLICLIRLRDRAEAIPAFTANANHGYCASVICVFCNNSHRHSISSISSTWMWIVCCQQCLWPGLCFQASAGILWAHS